jgi:hypothetical protein
MGRRTETRRLAVPRRRRRDGHGPDPRLALDGELVADAGRARDFYRVDRCTPHQSHPTAVHSEHAALGTSHADISPMGLVIPNLRRFTVHLVE